jgi:CHAT domain
MARWTVTLGVDKPPAAAHNILRMRAELRSEGQTVAVGTEGSNPVTAPLAELDFSTWQRWLGNQTHGDKDIWKRPDFEARIKEETGRIGKLLDLEAVHCKLSLMDPAPTELLVQVTLPHRALDALPWELLALYIEEFFPILKVHVFRSVEGTEYDEESRSVENGPTIIPMRVLLVDSSPLTVHSTNFSEERKAIGNGLRRITLCHLIEPDVRLDVDYLALSAALRQGWRLVHISAHGVAGELWLKEVRAHNPLSSVPFAELFRQQLDVAALMLSVCDSALGTKEKLSLARAATEVGIPCVVAMYSAISQHAALTFFTSLYRTLGQHRDMLAAYTGAVTALRKTSYPSRGSWSVPVLYTQENVIPFPRTPQIPDDPYEEHLQIASASLSQVSSLLPQPSWSMDDWDTRTRRFRMVTAPQLRRDLEKLTKSIIPAARASWRWAYDLSDSVRSILSAIELLNEVSTPSSTGVAAVARFHEGRQEFADRLTEFCQTLRALRQLQ